MRTGCWVPPIMAYLLWLVWLPCQTSVLLLPCWFLCSHYNLQPPTRPFFSGFFYGFCHPPSPENMVWPQATKPLVASPCYAAGRRSASASKPAPVAPVAPGTRRVALSRVLAAATSVAWRMGNIWKLERIWLPEDGWNWCIPKTWGMINMCPIKNFADALGILHVTWTNPSSWN